MAKQKRLEFRHTWMEAPADVPEPTTYPEFVAWINAAYGEEQRIGTGEKFATLLTGLKSGIDKILSAKQWDKTLGNESAVKKDVKVLAELVRGIKKDLATISPTKELNVLLWDVLQLGQTVERIELFRPVEIHVKAGKDHKAKSLAGTTTLLSKTDEAAKRSKRIYAKHHVGRVTKNAAMNRTAKELGISFDTVKRHLARAKK